MKKCLFCSIASGEIPSYAVFENDRVKAFLDINPCAIGHVIIIPRIHVSRIEELSTTDSEALFNALYKLLNPIRVSVGASDTTIGINNGPGSGQEIPHVHIHIIPRNLGDGGGIIQSIIRIRKPSPEQLKHISEKIIKQINFL